MTSHSMCDAAVTEAFPRVERFEIFAQLPQPYGVVSTQSPGVNQAKNITIIVFCRSNWSEFAEKSVCLVAVLWKCPNIWRFVHAYVEEDELYPYAPLIRMASVFFRFTCLQTRNPSATLSILQLQQFFGLMDSFFV